MRKSRFTETQIIEMVKEQEAGMPIAEVCRKHGLPFFGVDPKTVRRERPPDNPEIREEMKAVAAKRRRFGYRGIGVMFARKE